MQKIWEQYKSQGLRILGIAADETKAETVATVREHGLTYQNVWADPNSQESTKLAEGFLIDGYPRTIFVNKQGLIVDDISGVPRSGKLEERLEKGLRRLGLKVAETQTTDS